MSNLFVLTFDSEEKAAEVLTELGTLQKQNLITLEDAAVAVKDQKGKVKVTQTLEKRQKGAATVWGGFWGLLIGLIFGGPIFWALFTGLLARFFAKGTDLGIDNTFIKEVGDSLEPGGSALFMLVIEAVEDKVVEDLKQFGGKLFSTSLSKEDEEKLRKALEDDTVAEAATAATDLDD